MADAVEAVTSRISLRPKSHKGQRNQRRIRSDGKAWGRVSRLQLHVLRAGPESVRAFLRDLACLQIPLLLHAYPCVTSPAFRCRCYF